MRWPDAQHWRAPVGDFPPPWASAWGDDRHGLWAELVVGGVTQRMRWIEPTGPGGFWMGSPQAEREAIKDKDYRRWASEREHEPQPIVIPAGFWLADTPCTQALWMAVAGGENPSHFTKGDDASERPVERVSWDDVQTRFMPALAQALDHTAVPLLPEETQWEYACRAGTRTAYHWGDDADARLANFGGTVGQTTAVKTYLPNAWGLYDLHGNVWEWCADPWNLRWQPLQAEVAAMAGPRAEGGSAGANRAVRGGSWSLGPANARSACRLGRHPGSRDHNQGFRFALRSQSPVPGGRNPS